MFEENDTLPPLSPTKRNEADERRYAKDRLTTPPPTNGEIMQRVLKQDAQSSPVVPKPKFIPIEDRGIPDKTKTLNAQISYSSTTETINATGKKRPREVSPEHLEVVQEIHSFEKILKNLNLDEPDTKLQLLHKSAHEFVVTIRERKKVEILARTEREKRRRRILIEQQDAQKELENKKREELMLQKLSKQSREEREITAKLLEVRKQKEIIRKNRLKREEEAAEKRRKDYEAALARDADIFAKSKTEYERRIQLEKERFEAFEKQRLEEKKEKRKQSCRRIVNDIIDLAAKAVEYKLICDNEVPTKEFLEWKILFVSGKPIKLKDEQPISENPEEELLNEEEVSNYLNGETDWKYDEIASLLLEGEIESPPVQDINSVVVIPKPNLIFATIFDELSLIISPPSPPPEVIKLPDFPVKACILGKVFSGKTTQAQRICEKYNTNLISPDQVIHEATVSLREAEHNWLIPNAKQFAESAVKSLKDGKEVEDKALVGLLIEKIRTLEKSDRNGGWLIDGFPRTANQAQLFEKELTGFEPPKVRKRKATVKRGTKLVPVSQTQEVIEPLSKSGIDIIYRLDVSDEMIMKRSVGRKKDPETGKIYHMEFNPPPVDSQMINERLLPLDGPPQLQNQLHAHHEQYSALNEWFSMFGNIKAIEGNGDINSIWIPVDQSIARLLEAKEKEAERVKLEEERKIQQALLEEQIRREKEEKAKEEARKLEELKLQEQKKEEEKKGTAKGRRKPPSTTNMKGSASPKTLKTTESSEEPNTLRPTEDFSKASLEEEIPSITNVAAIIKDEPQTIEIPKPEDGSISDPNSDKSKEQKVDAEIAGLLVNKWKEVENHYLVGIRKVFQIIRKERAAILSYLATVRQDYVNFLNRRDDFQPLISSFTKLFNLVDNEMRDDVDTKNELHQRSEDLKEALWVLVDKRRDENQEEKNRIIKNGWLDNHLTILVNSYISLMQMELDRYLEGKQFLTDYFKSKNGEPLEENFQPIDLPLIGSSLRFKPPPRVATKKKKLPPPNQSKNKKEDPFPDLSLTLERGLSLIPESDVKKSIEELDEHQQSLLIEDDTLKKRLFRIKQKGYNILTELKGMSERAYQKLDDWLGQKFKAECNNVEKFVGYVKEMIETEQTLPLGLMLDGSDIVITDQDLTPSSPVSLSNIPQFLQEQRPQTAERVASSLSMLSSQSATSENAQLGATNEAPSIIVQ